METTINGKKIDHTDIRKSFASDVLIPLLSGNYFSDVEAAAELTAELVKYDKMLRILKTTHDEALQNIRAVNPDFAPDVSYFRKPRADKKEKEAVSEDIFG